MKLTQILHLFRDAQEPDEAVTKRQLDALERSGELDGGRADSIYTTAQVADGGGA